MFSRLDQIKIYTTPTNPIYIAMCNGWKFANYTTFARILHLLPEDIAAQISKNAFSFWSGFKKYRTFFIVYNEELSPEEILYNIAHEIGHIYFGHISPQRTLNLYNETPEEEALADQFARYILGIPEV